MNDLYHFGIFKGTNFAPFFITNNLQFLLINNSFNILLAKSSCTLSLLTCIHEYHVEGASLAQLQREARKSARESSIGHGWKDEGQHMGQCSKIPANVFSLLPGNLSFWSC